MGVWMEKNIRFEKIDRINISSLLTLTVTAGGKNVIG
jgi:hypothetical protein